MVDLKQKFEEGQTWRDWIESTEKNQNVMLDKFANFSLKEEDSQFLRGLKKEVHVLAIAESWCGDVVRQVPIVAKLCEQSNKILLRFIERDTQPEVMERYLNNGAKAIPVFIFFSENFIEAGNWKARPTDCNELFARYKISGDIETGRKKCKAKMDASHDRMTVDEIKRLIDIAQGCDGIL